MAVNNQQAVFKQSRPESSIDIYLLGVIGDPEEYTSELQAINSAGQGDEITLYINSIGGNLLTAYQLYIALSRTEAEIFVSVEGDCMSAATLFLACANYFFIATHSRIMFHTYTQGVYGKSHEIESAVEHARDWRNNLFAEVYKGILTQKEIDSCFNGADIYMTAEELSKRLENKTGEQ